MSGTENDEICNQLLDRYHAISHDITIRYHDRQSGFLFKSKRLLAVNLSGVG